MSTYSYPANDLEQADRLLALLGTHWQYTYQGQSLVRSYVAARAQEEAQSHLNLLETIAALCRLEVPLFHTDNWYMLTLRESERNSDPLRYGEGAVYGTQATGEQYFYGVSAERPIYHYPIPDNLADVTAVFNRITSPSLTWTYGADYIIDRQANRIVFREDPLRSDLVAKRTVFVDDVGTTDQEAALWLFKGQFDLNLAYEQFGYVLKLYTATSNPGYSALMNAIFDALVEGSAAKHVELALSAMAGIPLVQEAQEQVEFIQTDRNNLVIATDKHAYRYNRADVARVAVGDIVHAGDCLTTAIQVYEFNRGAVPSSLRSLTVDEGFITGYVDGLTFKNEDVPLVVEEGVNGKTKISFELGGFITDVEKFWDDVHARGVAEGTTLANLLDVRGPTAATEPTAASLPATVNPLQFLIENILRFNSFAVVIHTSRTGRDAFGFQNVASLRKILPPWTTAFIIHELDCQDTVTLGGSAGSASAPGYVEDASTFTATDTISEAVDGSSQLAEYVTIRLVEGMCE